MAVACRPARTRQCVVLAENVGLVSLAASSGKQRGHGMTVSLILATYGRAEELGRAVDSLLSQTDRGFELIIVDKNPDERLEPFVEQAREGVLVVRHVLMDTPKQTTTQKQNNTQTRHDILAFPDDDCWYED